MTTLSISSEQEAWNILQRIQTGEEVSPKKLELGDWAKTRVYIPGPSLDSSTSVSMMEGFKSLQVALHRTYGRITHGTPRYQLSDAEKQELDLVIYVTGGSSDQSALVGQMLESIYNFSLGFKKMEPRHVITLMTLVLLIFTVPAAVIEGYGIHAGIKQKKNWNWKIT